MLPVAKLSLCVDCLLCIGSWGIAWAKIKDKNNKRSIVPPYNLQLWNVGPAIMLSGHHEMLGLTVFFLTNYGIVMSLSQVWWKTSFILFQTCKTDFRLVSLANFLMSPLGYVLHHLTCPCRDMPIDSGCLITAAKTSHRPCKIVVYQLANQHDQCQPQGHFLHVCSSWDRPWKESHIHGQGSRPVRSSETKPEGKLSLAYFNTDQCYSVPLSEI